MTPTKEEFVRLWTSAQAGVAAFISAMVPDYHAAEDILQECAAILFQKFADYDYSKPFLSWAIGVSRLEILSRRRRFSLEKLVLDDAALENIAIAYDQLGGEVDDRVMALRYCADKVQGRSRRLLDLRYGRNLKPKDIAKQLGSTPNATSVALARIRTALRECIEKLLTQDRDHGMKDMVSLTEAFIDGALTPSEAELLCKAVGEDIQHAKAFTRELLLHRRLYDIFHGESVLRVHEMSGGSTGGSEWRYDSVVLPAIVEAPEEPAESATHSAEPDPSPPPRAEPRENWNSLAGRWWKAAAAVLLAAGLTFAVVTHRRPSPAMFTQFVDAQWEDAATRTKATRIERGNPLSLASGFCALHFGDGTQVIVEGPARFTVESIDRMRLSAGKLTAVMTPNAKGFVVETPSSAITDLGTEFGVRVDAANGVTEVDVFKGSVRVAGLQPASGSLDVIAGDAALVTDNTVRMMPATALPQDFVRDLASQSLPLDVADLVSGGDGLSHRRGGMIDASSGAAGWFNPIGEFAGDNVYHLVSSLPVVDGCFVPDGSAGDVQVDSAGHRVSLPMTDGGSFAMIVGGNHLRTRPTSNPISTVIGGVDYSKPGHWFLFLHANVGITFNLAAIRKLHPGLSVSRFRATVGNSFPYDIRDKLPGDIYCIVDGVSRFARKEFQRTDTFAAEVPLNDSDRFLTIVTTAGGAGNAGHDILLGDCVLETRAMP